MKLNQTKFAKVDMDQQDSKLKTNRWRKRRLYLNKQEFIGKQNAWDKAIRGAVREQQLKAEQRKKSKESRKTKNVKRGK